MIDLAPGAILADRHRAGSRRGHRDDPYHLALVFEGGGMRGVVSVAMASAFEELGYFDVFDSVHGSSAGACGAAYFAAGQADYGASIYYEDINNKRFIDLTRPLRGQAIMDKDFLIDRVMRQVKPLATDRVFALGDFVNIVATNVASGTGVIFNRFRDSDHLFRVLKASICLPVIAGKPVPIDGATYLDGGLVQQIAIESAISAGATHIIVLMTRRSDEVKRPVSRGLRLDAEFVRMRYGDAIGEVVARRNSDVNRVLSIVESGRASQGGATVRIDSIVRPSDSANVGRLTIDGAVLKQAYHDAREVSFAYIASSVTNAARPS